jgi:hypothetical protein
MDYHAIKIFLPAFMIVFFGTIALWAYVRKNKSIKFSTSLKKQIKPELKLVDLFFKILLIISIALAVVYAYFPQYYYLAGPIAWLDNPVINFIGILVLKTSLVWIVMAQFNIERSIALLNSGFEQGNFSELLNYSQKLILTGVLIMFLGLFITISSVVAILICISAALLFDRVQRLAI